MDYDLIKAIGPAMVALITMLVSLPLVIKAWAEYRHVRRSALRAECDFAWDLSSKLDDTHLKRYAQQLSYAVLIPTLNLTFSQREALLSLKENERAISLFVKCKDLITVSEASPVVRWKSNRYIQPAKRRVWRWGFTAAYILTILLGFSPTLGWVFAVNSKPIPTPLYVFQAIIAPFFLAQAVGFLLRRFRLEFAEELISLLPNSYDADECD